MCVLMNVCVWVCVCACSLVPRPRPSTRKEGLGTLVDFLGILCVSNHVTHAYAHAHFSDERVIANSAHCVVPRGRGLGSRHT